MDFTQNLMFFAFAVFLENVNKKEMISHALLNLWAFLGFKFAGSINSKEV